VNCDDRISLISTEETTEDKLHGHRYKVPGNRTAVSPLQAALDSTIHDDVQGARWFVKGIAENTSENPVRDVVACVNDSCEDAAVSLGSHAKTTFSLDISKVKGSGYSGHYSISFNCKKD
jgi:hypothetical protein